MNEIQNFREIRVDGNIIYDYMKVTDIKWEPCKIKTVQWEFHGKLIEFNENPEIGIVSYFLKDKDIVVFPRTIGSKEKRNYLTVCNPDGSTRFSLPNKLELFGEIREGLFLWISESKQYTDEHHFVIVFSLCNSTAMYHILINSDTGETKYLSEAR